ncbi:MAG: substrate-binding domain-containing protein [Pseudomonadota bacterium]|jgi:phosphate transport system substrate-binding protein|nr:substrate-binding domain-containing protein [Xanthomonadaceae bacterium]MDE3211343.1 substrate-binding domain-containing protein [Pseudomonadota bacterium]
MSVRLARLLAIALIGACLSTTAFARTHHKAKGSRPARHASELIWRGDDATANGVVDEVAKAWQRSGHGRIELQPFNTASGIDAVANGTADLAGSARESDGSAENSNLTFTPVAWDGLVIAVQASNPVRSLTLKQVHDIYYGKIHNWSEVGGNNAPIDVYSVASPGDGVEYSLRTLLFGRGNQPVAAPRLYVNTNKLMEGIALNPNGMGAATLAGIAGNRKLRALAIDGTAATAANVANGSYPLFTPLYMVTNPRSPKRAEVQAFLDFMQSAPAKAVLRSHDVLPYQDGAALLAKDDSRRSRIFAEVGVRASDLPARQASQRADVPLAAVNSAAAAQVPAASGNAAPVATRAAPRMYTVAKGDTLSLIARHQGVEMAQLRKWNHLKGDMVRLGQVLQVSGP